MKHKRLYTYITLLWMLVGIKSFSFGQYTCTVRPDSTFSFKPNLILYNIKQNPSKTNFLFLPSLTPQGFFCKQEDKISSKSKLNVRFRLGSLDYTNALEGK